MNTPKKTMEHQYRGKFMSERCRFCREFHSWDDDGICIAIKMLEEKDAQIAALAPTVSKSDEETAKKIALHQAKEMVIEAARKVRLSEDLPMVEVMYELADALANLDSVKKGDCGK